MKTNDNRKIVMTSSLALFSMFFGAGNMIFPPTLGRWAGDGFIPAMAGFLLTSVGIVMLAVISTTLVGGGLEDNAKPLGKRLSTLFGLAIMLSIGPGLAIPRTAATTYELVEASFNLGLSPIVVSLIFFAIVLFFTFNPAGVVDSLGNILTPSLLIALGVIIVGGIINPIGPIVDTGAGNVFSRSFQEGYQTMDGLAAFAFAGVIINGFKSYGINSPIEQAKLTRNAGIIAGSLLAIIYGGLTIIGATTSSLNLGDISRVDLLVFIAESLIGNLGLIFLTIAMILACLTTAIGLTASVGSFFERISNGKISYRVAALVSTLFSLIFATIGVDNIVQISAPILTFIYPIAIVMTFLNLAGVQKNLPAFYGGVAGAFVYSVLVTLNIYNPKGLETFSWIIFSLVGIAVFVISHKFKK